MRYEISEFSTAKECEEYLNEFSKKRKIIETTLQTHFKNEEKQTKYLLFVKFV